VITVIIFSLDSVETVSLKVVAIVSFIQFTFKDILFAFERSIYDQFKSFTGFSQDVVCPVCQRTVPADDAEVHLLMCLTRPRVTYNEDVLSEDKGECAICLEEMVVGDIIARLECFCIYHKTCIDKWFKIKNCCPEHPGDD
ncbi:unnamed protein product, partial [Enterobius vermicularis]|uniref:E3 ubiquitin-protein ligase ZNRF1 n=1 Tax=Enterobius vermicularis TaxID=51028 RepID=A0A0N4V7B4_ENTVE